MGAWGIKALESDAGLDFIDFLENYYSGKKDLILSEIIEQMLKKGFLSEESIDFFYDNSVISLAELIIMFNKNGEFDYDNEDINISLREKKIFEIDQKSIEFILKCLIDIKNEKPDEDGMREYVELWKESESYDKWKQHLDDLIFDFKQISEK